MGKFTFLKRKLNALNSFAFQDYIKELRFETGWKMILSLKKYEKSSNGVSLSMIPQFFKTNKGCNVGASKVYDEVHNVWCTMKNERFSLSVDKEISFPKSKTICGCCSFDWKDYRKDTNSIRKIVLNSCTRQRKPANETLRPPKPK